MDNITINVTEEVDDVTINVYDSTAALRGGTTGQIASKASDDDLDIVWIDNTGGGGSVDSVNGQTGVVVLDATDVGADPFGAAAAAETDANNYTDSQLAFKQSTSAKDASGGYVGLTLFKINFKNVLNTFTSFFTNANTAVRTYLFMDRDGTIADTAYVNGAFLPLNGMVFSGQWKASGFFGSKVSSGAGFNGFIYYTPFYITVPDIITEIGTELVTGAVGNNIRFGIYADNGSGVPGALIQDSGNISAATNGFKSFVLTTPLQLNPSSKLIWLATQASTAMVFKITTTGAGHFLGHERTGNNSDTQRETMVFGAFPATATPTVFQDVAVCWFVKSQ